MNPMSDEPHAANDARETAKDLSWKPPQSPPGPERNPVRVGDLGLEEDVTNALKTHGLNTAAKIMGFVGSGKKLDAIPGIDRAQAAKIARAAGEWMELAPQPSSGDELDGDGEQSTADQPSELMRAVKTYEGHLHRQEYSSQMAGREALYARDIEVDKRKIDDLVRPPLDRLPCPEKQQQGTPENRSSPMSKAQLARRILNNDKARPRQIIREGGWKKYGLSPSDGCKFTVDLNSLAIDPAMRARLEKLAGEGIL